MPEKTPAARGDRLIDALIVWITPARPLDPGINRFEVRVSEPGDTWIERLQVRGGAHVGAETRDHVTAADRGGEQPAHDDDETR